MGGTGGGFKKLQAGGEGMISKKIAACAFVINAGVMFSLTGCTDSSSSASTLAPAAVARIDEAGLKEAVGSPVVYETSLDDGHGFSFTPKIGVPAFKLEFRKSPVRMNVAWQQYADSPDSKDANTLNTKWATQVLTYAIGADSATRVMSADKPLSFTQAGHKINVIPGAVQTLVTISAQ